MYADLYLALAIGLVLSLIVSERWQVIPAGLIVPGYLALLVPRPLSLLGVLAISLLAYVLVKHVIARRTILYGRRKFVAMMLTGMICKLTFDGIVALFSGGHWLHHFEVTLLTGVGIVVPGLIANTMERQGVRLTLTLTIGLSLLTFLILFVVTWFL